ncbi:hypothetical protein [Pseudooceanicola sp.]|uniref:hypothetical protein n=1 Tax=Pseudooceanicola sp. TaxID=1914328 RepID=UPI002605CCA6|nr:hypothetical protein [Pseudooceanicola sp.]MDF1855755.1 hypothetical protein [Pseudooceanicola sp.]
MFNFNHPDQQTFQTLSLVRALRKTPVTLPSSDYQKLQEHLENCEGARRPSSKLLAHVLANKLMNTRPVDDVRHSDVVIGGSCVTYVVDGEAPQTGLLVHRARSGLSGGVIPVASLLGATLIGMRTGQRAPLLFEDGTIGRLCVIETSNAI